MVMVGCSFAIALAVQKTNIWIFFGGSIERLFLLAAGVFALLKWGAYRLFRRRDEPPREQPKFPGP
jgi:membrane protein implicated in regulation of membrane protease activity